MTYDEVIGKLRSKGLNLSKRTHPDKDYITHINECVSIVKLLMETYNFEENIKKFAILLCSLHDVGKLLDTWDLNMYPRPPHSIEGAEWLLNNKDILTNNLTEVYINLLIYAILTHHSPLYVPAEYHNVAREILRKHNRDWYNYKTRNVLNNLNMIIRKLDIKTMLDLADVMGIVKLADIISAKNIDADYLFLQYLYPKTLGDETAKNIIVSRAYERRKSFDPYKFQKQLDIALSQKPHIIIVAPTGWGKTNLALLRFIRKRPVKLIYVLPTITAIRDFYDMFTTIFPDELVGEYFYFADAEFFYREDLDEEKTLDLYKYFVPKILITTIDQLLLTTLQVGKYYIRRFNLRNSLLVIDEFHLLTREMIAALRVFLKHLSDHYKMLSLFMSATPSPVYIELIKKIFPEHKRDVIILKDEYKKLKRHKIEIDDEDIINFIMKRSDLLNKRVLILVNTVKKAQNIYRILKDEIKNKKIHLIHGDFAFKDRVDLENKISNSDILVSTQVAEVSLDISFDVLITELAPIPSLIQRFGRVNRYGDSTSDVNIYICTKLDTSKPYSDILIKQSRKYLPILSEKLEEIGEEVYLDERFWEYEELFKDDIENIESFITKNLEILHNFYSVIANEEYVLRILGREETWLAIPDIYLDIITDLYNTLRNLRSYNERRKIYAQIKSYLTPASRNHIKNAIWHDELNLPIVRYDKELGIVDHI